MTTPLFSRKKGEAVIDSGAKMKYSQFFCLLNGEHYTREGLSYGANDMRDGVTQSKQRRQQPRVTVTDIQNLKVNHCYLRGTKGKIKHLKLGLSKKKEKENDY